MGSLLASCMGSCCASCACSACEKCCPSVDKRSRIPYLAIFFASVVVAIILLYWGGPMLIDLYFYQVNVCDTDKCLGYGAVFRISFALFTFFMIFAFFCYCGCGKADGGHWILKIFAYLCLLVVSYLLPDEFYDVYVHIARLIGGVFLFLQICLLVIFAYNWNSDWLSEEKGWKNGILAASFVFYSASLVILVFCFRWFGGSGCPVNNFLIVFTLIFTLVFTVISATEWCEHGAILPSAVMTIYCYYLLFSALNSDPSSCNTLQSDSPIHLVVGLLISCFSICNAAWNLATSSSLFGEGATQEKDESYLFDDDAGQKGGTSAKSPKVTSEKDVEEDPVPSTKNTMASVNSTGEAAEAAVGKKSDEHQKSEEHQEEDALAHMDEAQIEAYYKSIGKFHLVMAAAAMYMAMLLTNWGSRQSAEDDANGTSSDTSYDLGVESMWIKIVTEWVAAALYIWTLIAPYVLPNRDFS